MSAPGSDLRVLIIADDPLARAGLAALLTSLPGFMVVGQMGGEADVLTELAVYLPDVVLWDLGWDSTRAPGSPRHPGVPEPEGFRTSLERLADLRDAGPPVVVLLPDATQGAAAWAAGARGLVLRDAPAEQLAASLQAVEQGLVALDGTLAASLVPTSSLGPAPLAEALTPRELEVLQWLAEGLPNKTIADRLHISEHTVKFHVNALMGKLGAQSRTEAVVRATRLGWLLL